MAAFLLADGGFVVWLLHRQGCTNLDQSCLVCWTAAFSILGVELVEGIVSSRVMHQRRIACLDPIVCTPCICRLTDRYLSAFPQDARASMTARPNSHCECRSRRPTIR